MRRAFAGVLLLALAAANAATAQHQGVSPGWAHPAPRDTLLPATPAACGGVGSGGDTATNARKNRVDRAATYHRVAFDSLARLPYPRHHPKSRLQWLPPARDSLAQFEGAAVRVTGFLAGVKVESGGGGETANCHLADSAHVDWHMWLVGRPGDPKAAAVVVETTPRVRRAHPRWTPARLAPAVAQHDSVRISGWLMFDPEHAEQLGGTHPTRTTLWEIHPVMKIEVFTTGRWVALDSL